MSLLISDRYFHGCRAKITHDLAQVINDGLFHYEEDLWNDDEGDWVCEFLCNTFRVTKASS